MQASLDFTGMPINFNKKMYLYKGERPDSARARPVAVIAPGEIGMLTGSLDYSTEEGVNPLTKYFEEANFPEDNYGLKDAAK